MKTQKRNTSWFRQSSRWLAPLTVGLVLLCLSSHVQAQDIGLSGQVVDAQDRAIPGVTVSVHSSRLVAPVVVVTDATGTYRFPTLDPGNYDVVFSIVGFQRERRSEIQINAGESSVLDVQLRVAQLTQQVDVVGVTPLLGTALARTRVPATVAIIGSDELQGRGSPSLADSLNARLGSVSLEGATTNLFQPTLRFRGFTASPLLGLPQGVAVYQNGVRINEPFGDTVQFDLMPQFAVSQVQLSAGADPVFGLNALGGALALRLKNGFDFNGFRGEFAGGSFGRFTATAEYGADRGPWALYLGSSVFKETGWRDESPSEVGQVVADVGYRQKRVDDGLTLTVADSSLNGNGPAPVELLSIDRTAVFTHPDNTKNRLGFLQGRYNFEASSTWSLQVTGYYRDLDRRTLNGDEAEFSVCDDDSLPSAAPINTLCQGAGDDDEDEDEGVDESAGNPLVDALNPTRFITTADGIGNGAINRTNTQTQGYGATLQATNTNPVGDRENMLVIGTSIDLAQIAFGSNSEVGSLTATRGVTGSGLFAGLFGKAPDDIFNTRLDSSNQGVGLYFSDTLSLSQRAHLTMAGRFNQSQVDIQDRLGTSLNGDHTFSRFNPSVGLVIEGNELVSTFVRYSESNRSPTAAELSCADPAEPCRVPNAFMSDPPLEQAVARSTEGGLRGNWANLNGSLEWSASLYSTRINDDILFIASPALIGTGYFQNAGDTLRNGIDLNIQGQFLKFGFYLGYGLVNATFQTPVTLPGDDEVNDAVNDDGQLEIAPGDRLAGIPKHSLKTGLSIRPTNPWSITLETMSSSSRVFVGDEGNDQIPLDGYQLVNVRTAIAISEATELFAQIDNLFDANYQTFGILAELEIDLDEAPNATDPRFVAPGNPRSAFAGVRVRF